VARRRYPGARRWLPASCLAGVAGWACYLNLCSPGRANPAFDEVVYQLAGWRYVHGQFTAICFVPTVVLGPVIIRRTWQALLQAGACGLAALVAFALTYLPQGARTGWQSVTYMVARQAQNSAGGHRVPVAGRPYQHPPWWAHLWWQTHSYGLLLTGLLAAGVLACLLVGPRVLSCDLLSAYVIPLGVTSLALGVALPYYYTGWQTPLYIAAAIGVGSAATRLPRRAGATAAPVAAAAALLAVPAARATAEVQHAHRSGYGTLIETLRTAPSPADRPVVLLDPDAAFGAWQIASANETAPPDRRISWRLTPPAIPDSLRAVVVAAGPPDPATRPLVTGLGSHPEWRPIQAGDNLVIWLHCQPTTMPTVRTPC
jgi:hypothetical protein